MIKDLLKRVHDQYPQRWTECAKEWRGVSEETTTGVHRLYKMIEEGHAAGAGDQCERLGDEVEVR